MLRQAALVLLMAAVLSPAGTAARYSHAAAPNTPRPAQRVVVRTQLVPASSDGFDWSDAGIGAAATLGLGCVVLAAFALRAGGARRPRATGAG
jgi:hypothetical protein